MNHNIIKRGLLIVPRLCSGRVDGEWINLSYHIYWYLTLIYCNYNFHTLLVQAVQSYFSHALVVARRSKMGSRPPNEICECHGCNKKTTWSKLWNIDGEKLLLLCDTCMDEPTTKADALQRGRLSSQRIIDERGIVENIVSYLSLPQDSE